MSVPTDHSTEGNRSENGSAKPDKDPSLKSADELEADIAEARDALGETVAALTAKADVKSRARARMADVRGRARTQLHAGNDRGRLLLARAKDATTDEGGETRKAVPVTAGLVTVAAVTVGAVLVWRIRRNPTERGRAAVRRAVARRAARSTRRTT